MERQGGPDTEVIMKDAAILDRRDTFPTPPFSTALQARRHRAPDITIAREVFHAQP